MGFLAGKWVWIWNWRRCDGGDADLVARRLKEAGCAGAIVKAWDGGHWFDQGAPWREIGRALKDRGLAVGGWGYCYGRDPRAEAQRALETAGYGEAGFLVLDVESEFEGHPEAAEELCSRLREGLGPEYPLYFSSFAIARYHRSFPFHVFAAHCTGAAPQVYWNAFRRPMAEALAAMYEDYAAVGITPACVFPVGGLYQEDGVRYPQPADVRGFAAMAAARGSLGVSFWSYEHMSQEMWEALREAAIGTEEGGMSSQEFEEVMRAVRDLSARVERLEAQVGAVASPPALQPARTYTVQPGDTLSGIAAKLGLPGWRGLYEANATVIGPDPNLIYPGQVLSVP